MTYCVEMNEQIALLNLKFHLMDIMILSNLFEMRMPAEKIAENMHLYHINSAQFWTDIIEKVEEWQMISPDKVEELQSVASLIANKMKDL
jgi:hypothetical protein